MAGDLVAHDAGLLAHLGGERIVAARRRLVHHHRQRRLERMREIADMGAGALDDLAVGVDQRVGLARQRRDLDREMAGEPLGGAGADRGEAFRDALERREAEAHLEHGGEQQHGREHREGHDDRAVERVGLVVDLLRVARDRDQVAAVLAEIDGALDQAQPLVLRPRHIGAARAVVGRRRRPGRRDAAGRSPTASATSAPRASSPLSRVTCQYQPDSGRSNCGSPSDCEVRSLGFVGRRHLGDQRAQKDVEPAVERALDRVAIERGQHEAGDQQDDDRPGGRRDEQAQRERVSAHRSAA